MRFSDLKNIFQAGYEGYSILANGKRFYQLKTAITANSTTTTAPVGSFGVTSHATGRNSLFYSDGSKWQAVAGGGGGSVTRAIPTGAVNGINAAYVFPSSPKFVFRNGVNETRLGSISTNTFTFDTPPATGDDIEGLI
jgi:hypothetical protein